MTQAPRANLFTEPAERIGFKTIQNERDSSIGHPAQRQFNTVYGDHIRGSGSQVLPGHIVEEDLKLLSTYATQQGKRGILLMLDEAHMLAHGQGEASPWKLEVKRQLRRAVQESGRCGIIFAGEPVLSRLFTDVSEPLYAQGRIIPVKNFAVSTELSECALLPLKQDERSLMSPMTIDYLERLSRGKPNQVRLICYCLYERYRTGEQSDLNMTIDVLEDVTDLLASQLDHDLKGEIRTIRSLSSIDLEFLYNMTRYQDWPTKDLVSLDETFRGESRTNLCMARRERILEEKRQQFVSLGLLTNVPDKCCMVGGEFAYLYVRFWYEIRKFGKLRRSLVLGRGPASPFGERTQKLVRFLAWELRRNPGIQFMVFHSQDRGNEDILGKIRHRYAVLDKLAKREKPPSSDIETTLGDCLDVCELVKQSGPYHLVCLPVRNLENPREVMQIELYFESTERPLEIPIDTLRDIRRQADEAKVLIEGFENYIVNLPDLVQLLNSIGLSGIDELTAQLPLVQSWHLAAVQRLLHDSPAEEPGAKDEDLDVDFSKAYAQGDLDKAETVLTSRIEASRDQHKSARLFNNRGYIRYAMKGKDELSLRDLQMAIDFHHENLPITLLNMAIADIDATNYNDAIKRIEQALFLTLSRETIEASYLRLRLLPSHLAIGKTEKWEQHPANVLEAAYVNLAYALAHSDGGVALGQEALHEGLALLPSSIRLKHALARLHLFRNRADIADEIYEELGNKTIEDWNLSQEIDYYLSRIHRKKKK